MYDYMYYQFKVIRKGEKPPVWRRVTVPSNITFAQLAAILESLLEYPYSDSYEFEFYTSKKRFIEWKEGRKPASDFYYSYLNAADVYINKWMQKGKAFSFGLNDAEGTMPQYRIEVEKILDKVEDDNGILRCPAVSKQVSYEDEQYWTDMPDVNDRMKAFCFTVKSEGEYLGIAEILKKIDDGQGIAVCKNLKSRNIHESMSVESKLKFISENIDFLIR